MPIMINLLESEDEPLLKCSIFPHLYPHSKKTTFAIIHDESDFGFASFYRPLLPIACVQ